MASLPAQKLELVSELRGHKDRVWCADWSPNGQVFATASGDSTIRIWGQDASGNWCCKHVLEGVHTRTVRSVAWSPDGKFLASCGFDGLAAIWRFSDGSFECIAQLEGHENEVKCVVWSRSGNFLATCSRDKTVWIWAANADGDFECVGVLHGHTQDVKQIRFHPYDECLISASYDDTIKVWVEDGDDWVCNSTLQGHQSTVWGISFNAAGDRFVSCSDDRTLIVWERDKPGGSWSKSTSLPNNIHSRTIFSVDWSKANSLIATAAADDAIRIFQLNSSGIELVHTHLHAHAGDVNCVSWAPSNSSPEYAAASRDRLLVSVGDDFAVRVWRWQP